MDKHIATEVIVREHVLVWTFVLTIFILITLATYLIPQIRRKGFYRIGWVRSAIALFVLMLGTAIRAGWVSGLLIEYTHSDNISIMSSLWQLDILAGALTVAGAVCVIREFALDGFGLRWAATATVVAALIDGVLWIY